MKRAINIILILCLAAIATPLKAVECGADQINRVLAHIEGRRVALIINHTSVVGPSQVCLLDTLLSRGADVKCVFAPEHGFRGDADAGASVADGRDIKSGTPIVSLYGKNKRPTKAQLADIDIVVFDIQDVGARFYTYISTMYYAMQSCAEFGKEFLVLDRPNPNDYIDGPMMQEAQKSFVGALPLPLLHGLTVGELAQMIDGEGWCGAHKAELSVIPMIGWWHGKKYSLPIKPSPNLPNDQAIALYPSLCLFEATEVSVGRGTLYPFQILGYPNPKYGEFTFTPRALKGSDMNPLQRDQLCYGDDLRQATPPAGLSLSYFIEYFKRSGGSTSFISRPSFFDLLAGNTSLRQMILQGKSEQQIRATWQADLAKYKTMRQKYLLYPDLRCH